MPVEWHKTSSCDLFPGSGEQYYTYQLKIPRSPSPVKFVGFSGFLIFSSEGQITLGINFGWWTNVKSCVITAAIFLRPLPPPPPPLFVHSAITLWPIPIII